MGNYHCSSININSSNGCLCVTQNKRKSITAKQAKIAYLRSQAVCFYCGKDISPFENRLMRFEIDHLVPVAKNGRSEQNNYVAACRECNNLKSDKTVEEFLESKQITTRRCFFLVFPLENHDQKHNQHHNNELLILPSSSLPSKSPLKEKKKEKKKEIGVFCSNRYPDLHEKYCSDHRIQMNLQKFETCLCLSCCLCWCCGQCPRNELH